ncbi:type I glyceraldehyde-3-phosphate dehydrogenase [Aestuariirhabdus litorea]|uniref:Glyceraldehyde-3-phosphate dehydrogenase n=1 Tax=Aestuariirhabdus litorea TaxID=2528527 RepID=A0A3P3VRH4_9GAMM|nr:type I glyceraldehyde-3-phosphate dehydrogenase [Aestuariirhabdus litorea]RRJ84286.1 type I glyceraldehyde-3-phosphate dehydrogenase [Aestuariirhabdus litorea]RWW97509.1 type I glyceraldehyde-3-phosphate dehydrogenase [Endozoicomonadaceae bacterium GTF-13]
MTLRIAINGFGRIGRTILRALYENGYRQQLQVVAINDLGDPAINAHLLQYDSVHGRMGGTVDHDQESLSLMGDRIALLNEPDPAALPWDRLGIDLVLECSGRFKTREAASAHLNAGARRVLISSPAKEVDATIVYGVNDHILKAEHRIVSNASCTTNCLAPVLKVLNDHIGVVNGLMTTIHAVTNDQHVSDAYHRDPYRARAAFQSIIPTKTGAAAAVGLVLPELAGRLDGQALRVPTLNVSVVDLSFIAARDTSVEEINQIMGDAASHSAVLDYNERPLVSIDFNHNPHSACFDAPQTRVCGRQVKVMAWYDNEWGYSNRMLDTALRMLAQ